MYTVWYTRLELGLNLAQVRLLYLTSLHKLYIITKTVYSNIFPSIYSVILLANHWFICSVSIQVLSAEIIKLKIACFLFLIIRFILAFVLQERTQNWKKGFYSNLCSLFMAYFCDSHLLLNKTMELEEMCRKVLL